ncbi:MAG: flagellar biosynthesis regulator FlaF [Alphaproteobacteria bacterium]|nr:flagellar biosynthesis regulator FlaF [Alphaproteobacteria bacterium]
MSNPYASQQRAALEKAPPQAAEGYALIEVARRMDEASRAPDDIAAIRNVVRLNWRVWTIFQAELVDPECQTPRQIRENLISLSNFIDKRSAELIGTPDASKLSVLVNINRQIGAGLLGNPSDDPEEAERLRVEYAQLHGLAAPTDTAETPEDFSEDSQATTDKTNREA